MPQTEWDAVASNVTSVEDLNSSCAVSNCCWFPTGITCFFHARYYDQGTKPLGTEFADGISESLLKSPSINRLA